MLKFGGSSYLIWDPKLDQHHLVRMIDAFHLPNHLNVLTKQSIRITLSTETMLLLPELGQPSAFLQAHSGSGENVACFISWQHQVKLDQSHSPAVNTRSTLSGVHRHSDKHATGKIPKAQCAFKILMIHEVLQFALRIAFRCVLHRCGNLDIHRWKLY